jgi:hypothetical protein
VKYSESFAEGEERLSKEDLLTLLAIDDAIHRPTTIGDLVRQVELDRKDQSTEYGGVLDGHGATLFVPDEGEAGLDRAFIAPRAMFQVEALAHFHFHAQAVENAEYAGPSAGDLEYAARFDRVCVVFTSVGRGKLDADVYFPSGVVVDLGEIGK